MLTKVAIVASQTVITSKNSKIEHSKSDSKNCVYYDMKTVHLCTAL